MRRTYQIAAIIAVILIAAGVLFSHGKGATAQGAPPLPEVLVATVQQSDMPIRREWVGTLDGMVNAIIKAQVTGYLLRQTYVEGSFVRKGQLLFEIDPRPFQAAVDQATAQLAQTHAQLSQAQAGLVLAQSQLASAE